MSPSVIPKTRSISTGALSDEELVGAASGVLASDLNLKAKAAAIRALVNR